MPDLLLELFSEEIPARMQARAADDLKKMVTDRLVAAGLVYEGAKAFATPRRLALAVQGVPARQPDVKEERKGPRVGAPDNAIAGFLKSAGLASIGEAKVVSDAKKGDFYVAVIDKPGRNAIEVIAEIIPEVVRGFPWPKSMRWGAPPQPSRLITEKGDFLVTESGDHLVAETSWLRWVRPLHSIVATFGPETEEPEIVPFEIDGIRAGDVTRGHRFLAPDEIKVRRLDDYVTKLAAAKVVLDPARRADIILHDAKHLAFAQGFELIEDVGLLAEVSGLVEWPVVLMGAFDEAFLAIPPEVIRTTIRNNQKCFVLRRSGPSSFETRPPKSAEADLGDEERRSRVNPRSVAAPQDEGNHGPHPEEAPTGPAVGRPDDRLHAVSKDGGSLANRFILTANTEAIDGGAAIIAGNERVIRARLSDAKFFYETDLKTKLEDRLEKLKEIVFHEKLGTQYERVERIERLARELSTKVGADPEKAARAARLAKADLVTDMVGEFPELQGLMGKYYALAQGEDASVANAIEDHYKPQGPNDLVPADPVSVAVALADKIDTLVGFWVVGEKPTGSKDPYALRRAALGVIRLVTSDQTRIKLANYFFQTIKLLSVQRTREHMALLAESLAEAERLSMRSDMIVEFLPRLMRGVPESKLGLLPTNSLAAIILDLLAFLADRLKVQLREQGARHDLVDAVFALEGQDDLLLVVRRVDALGKMLATDDGKNLLAGYKRAINILRIEEKKDGRSYQGEPDAALYELKEERDLATAITVAKREAQAAVAREDFSTAMQAIATLRPFVDAFFEKVTVNVPDSARRENRLKLLNEIREATGAVADFSKIEG